MLADIWIVLIPVYILAGLVLLLLVLNLLARVKGGKYVRPLAQWLMKLPWIGKQLQKASRASLEKQNPELASAVAKLERSGATRDPMRAQQALSRLSARERQAYIEAAGQQGETPEPMNRAQRRAAEKLKKQRR
jgi:secreted protein with Ig-like and vWFA domain